MATANVLAIHHCAFIVAPVRRIVPAAAAI